MGNREAGPVSAQGLVEDNGTTCGDRHPQIEPFNPYKMEAGCQ